MNDIVVLVTSHGMGKADEKLQFTLIEKYLQPLLQGSSCLLPYAFTLMV